VKIKENILFYEYCKKMPWGLEMITVKEFKEFLSYQKSKEKKHTIPLLRGSSSWRQIDGQMYFMRSKWESNYGRYLQFQKENMLIKRWLHEPETFWFPKIKRGVVSYKPDFKVINLDGSHYWVEVKGYMDYRSKTKIKRLKKYFPKENLIIVDSKWFIKNNPKLRGIVPEWE